MYSELPGKPPILIYNGRGRENALQPGSLFLTRNRQPKKPAIFRKLAAFNRKTDLGGKTKLRERKIF